MKEALTFEKHIKISQQPPQPLYFSMTRYADTLTIIVNQTGTLGSIIEGRVVEAAGLIIEEDQQSWEEEDQKEKIPLYDIRVMFGSTEIQFYEVWLRRLMGLIWEQKACKEHFRIVLNISLPALSPHFKQEVYYNQLVDLAREGLEEVL